MIYGVTDLTTFVLGTIFIVLLPGPNSLLVMTLASREGLKAGYWAAAGIFFGDTILMLLAATGAASALRASPAAFGFLKYAGAAYLAWLGMGLLRSAIQNRRAAARPEQTSTPGNNKSLDGHPQADLNTNDIAGNKSSSPGARHPFRTATLISLLNPKAIMFFVSFFIQFVDPAYPHPWMSFLVLGVIVQACSLAYLSALIFGGTRLAARFARHQTLTAAFTGAVGLLFIGFAFRLASANLA